MLALALALTLRAAQEPAPAAQKPDAQKPDAAEPAADVRTIAGKITALDWKDARFTIAAADGPLTVRVDRNTMVLLETRAGSVRDLAVGMPVRVNVGGPANLAYWVEARPRGLAPSAAKGAAAVDGAQ